ncbi:MAG: leucine-rich repeat protein [Lachnospiraceae bacterium]|nr:leucine-rich repeat protein [Lachnospiraceae bacterium]
MGKKGSKKINRRIKRSARKTIGVLTLIMAIIVAAIPTPSARAVGGLEDDTTVDPPVYPTSEADIPLENIQELKPGSARKYDSQLIYKSGDQYYLFNVYSYYMIGSGSNASGCIYDYNKSYVPSENKLTIPDQVKYNYPAFTREEILQYFLDNRDDILRDSDLQIYYKSEWDDWQKYVSDHAAWERLPDDQKTNGRNPEPQPPVAGNPHGKYKVEDFLISGDNWVNDDGLRYFCTHYVGDYAPDPTKPTERVDVNFASYLGGSTDYTLMRVTDERHSTGENAVVVYVPCKVGATINESQDYSNDFWVPDENTCHIRYIGDNAFEGATRIKELIIPAHIDIIGNDAFKGCTSIETISAYAGTIGNRAFKDCSSLKNVTLGTGVERIGTECFYGCNSMESISFPGSMEKIGFGAFAFCSNLNKIEMDQINTNPTLEPYCFFNCQSIGSVTFARNTSAIGEAAFALTEDMPLRNTSWKDIVLPDNAAILGDYVLYGRGNIETVVMPASFGTNATPASNNVLKSGFFGKCYGLQWVEFPDNRTGSCGYVTFDTDAFIDVTSEEFYIRGPELNGRRQIASPRECSWAAGITYVFKDGNGVDQYEVSTGTYRFAVDTNGVLTDCTLLNKTEWINQGGEIEIPATVGSKTVTGIGQDCFNDEDIKDNLRVLKIADGGAVASIADRAFEGYPKLEIVYIGDSINGIGTSAFENCNKLQTVVFSTPKGGYQNFKIGPNAFSTGSDQLIFYGDIVEGYAPFDWAMSKDNWMDAIKGLRVCYSSGTPEHPNLRVLLDNNTNLVTLVGYPHYDELDEEIRNRYEAYLTGTANPEDTILTPEQQECLDNVRFIVIPAGVESIDVKGFLMDSNANRANASAYMSDDKYYGTYSSDGLFNGYYGDIGSGTNQREYPEGSEYEQEAKGNDRIQTVTMSTVKYLPDRAFESCENLRLVVLGEAMEDVGTAPFTGCRNLTSVGGNSKYPCDNGIIYEKNDTGLTIVECLPARGSAVGSPSVNATTDPNLPNVTQINEGAFENCAYVRNVDFTTATKLTQIPKSCFKGAERLTTVLLPESVNKIWEEAFADTKYLSVTIPAVEVDIADDAFENTESVTLRSYKNSTVERYANRKDHDFEEIGRKYRVQFWDYDGTVIPIKNEDGTETAIQYVEHGRAAQEPEAPTGRTDGYIFDKWDKPFTNVTSDLVIIATYKWGYPNTSPGVLPNTSPGAGNNGNNNGTPTPTPNGTPGAGTPGAGTPGAGTPGAGTPGAGTPGASNGQTSNQRYKLTVQNGSGSGTYLAGTTVVITADAPPSGQRFDRWTSIANDFNITSATSSITTITMPSHDMTIVANYTSGSGSSNGNNGNSTDISSNTNGNGNSGGTTVDITKPGISDTDVASATVEGSTDNYIVKITDTAEARAAVEAALINEYGTLDNLRYFAMDISLYDSTGTVKITDTSNLAVNITMPIPDELRLYAGNNQVAGVVNGNVLDKLSPRFTTINGIPCISFTATHFSPYTVYVDTSNLSAGVSDSTPKTGDMIHPKWFLAVALACISFILLLKKDKKQANVKAA